MLSLTITTDCRVCLVDVTAQVAEALAGCGLRDGVLLIYVPHTTAGVTINESADPSVRHDIEMTLARLVPDDPAYTHREGNSDAHIKATLVGSSVSVPVHDGRLALGTWQGVFFAEFDGPRRRRLLLQPLA